MGADYRVLTRYDLDDHLSPGLGRIATSGDAASKSLGAISGVAGSLGGMLDSVASSALAAGVALAGVGVAGALAGVKTGLVGVNANLEDCTNGFATLFNMFGAANSFDQGLGMAQELMTGIRKDAASLPGEFKDFVSMAQSLTSPLLNAGKGLEDIRALTRDTVVAAAALKMPFEQAAREMSQLIEGHAGGHNVLGTKLGITKDTAVNGKAFNAATDAERVAFITEKLAKAKESLPALAKSWSGLTSTMVDGVKALLGEATLPLFGRLKDELVKVNGLLDSPQAHKLAAVVGNYLVIGFEKILDLGEQIASHWDEIQASAITFGHELREAFERVWPFVERLGNFLGEKLKDPGKALKELAMLRVGLGLAERAPSIVSGGKSLLGMFGGGGGANSAASGVASAAPAVGGLAGPSWGGAVAEPAMVGGAAGEGGVGALAGSEAASGALGGLAGAAGAAAIALAAVVGAFDVVTMDATGMGAFFGWVSESGKEMWGYVKDNFGALTDETKAMFADLWTAAHPLIDLMGIALLGAIDGVIYMLRAMIAPMRALAAAIAWVADKAGVGGGGSLGGAATSIGEGPGPMDQGKTDGAIAKAVAAWGSGERGNLSADKYASLVTEKAKGLGGKGSTTVNINAPITVLSDGDPERLAVGISTALEKYMRFPQRPLGIPTYRAA